MQAREHDINVQQGSLLYIPGRYQNVPVNLKIIY